MGITPTEASPIEAIVAWAALRQRLMSSSVLG